MSRSKAPQINIIEPDTVAAEDRLRGYVERVLRLQEERDGISTDIADIYAEAKGIGYDRKAVAIIVKNERMDPEAKRERDDTVDVYTAAIERSRARARKPHARDGEAVSRAADLDGAPVGPAPVSTADAGLVSAVIRESLDEIAKQVNEAAGTGRSTVVGANVVSLRNGKSAGSPARGRNAAEPRGSSAAAAAPASAAGAAAPVRTYAGQPPWSEDRLEIADGVGETGGLPEEDERPAIDVSDVNAFPNRPDPRGAGLIPSGVPPG